MCAINPTHKKRLILDVYTVEKFSKKEFESLVIKLSLQAEQYLNEKTRFRWHVKETDQQAD